MADADDDFVDILPQDGKAPAPAVTLVSTRLGRQRAVRLSLTFRPEKMDDDARAILAAPRFSIAFSRRLFCLRILPADGFGKFAMIQAPRGRAQILRLPLPEGLAFVEMRLAARWDVLSSPRALVVDLPRDYAAPARPSAGGGAPGAASDAAFAIRAERATAPPGDRAPALMGDPPPGRSALDRKRRGEA